MDLLVLRASRASGDSRGGRSYWCYWASRASGHSRRNWAYWCYWASRASRHSRRNWAYRCYWASRASGHSRRNWAYWCYWPQGLQGIRGETGPTGATGPQNITQPFANYIVNAVSPTGTPIPPFTAITQWTQPYYNSSSITFNALTGYFTVANAGVYLIISSVSVKPGTGDSLSRYSFSIDFNSTNPFIPSLDLAGLTTSDTSGGVLSGSIVTQLSANSQFRILNITSSTVYIVNGSTSGSAANLSIVRIADAQEL